MSDLGITDHVVIHVEEDDYHVVEMEQGDEVWSTFLHAAGIAKAMDGPRGETEMDALVIGEMYRPGEAWL